MAGQLTLAELRVEAEAMGLEGDDVNFVYKQQELYPDERAEERAARAAEAERVERAAEAERAKKAAEAEREIEREVRAADALEKERDKAREHEIRVSELNNSKGNFDQSMADAMRPKLPVFKDGDYGKFHHSI